MSALVPYEPQPSTLWRRVADAWRTLRGKALADTVIDFPEEYEPGFSQVPGVTVTPAYDPNHALSAYGAFPWVRVCIDAIGEDLARLPRKVVVGFGADAEEIDDHPFHELMLDPNPAQGLSRDLYYRERVLDWGCSGNAVRLVSGAERGEPNGLIRLHPDEVRPEPNGMGGVASWVSSGLGRAFYAEHCIHDRMVAWEGGAQMLLGESPIRTLDRALTTALESEKRAALMAASGQPQAILRPDPNDPTFAGVTLDADQRRKVRQSIEGALNRYGSGLVIMNRGFLLEKLGFSPREMEFAEVLFRVRDETLAVYGVTRTRAGLPEANYATARQQQRTYWEGLQGKAAMLDAQDSRLARMFTVWARRSLGRGWEQKQRSLRVVTDFASVEALQESRSERVNRVSIHIMNLAPALGSAEAARVAYAEEGFAQLAAALPEAQPEAPPEDEQDDATEDSAEEHVEARLAANVGGLRLFVAVPEPPRLVVDKGADAPPAEPPPADSPEAPEQAPEDEREAKRSATWRSFILRAHAPIEQSFQRAMYQALRKQARALADRLGEVLPDVRGRSKALSEDDLADLLNLAESMGLLRSAAESQIRRAIKRGVAEAMLLLGADLALNEDRLEALAQARLGEMVTNVTPKTRATVRRIVVGGIEEGLTTAEIQGQLLQHPDFSATRALAIARTETTGGLEAGSARVYDAAQDAGVKFQLEWLSARDAAVRPSHSAMDGQQRQHGQEFTSGAGNKASRPGGFGVAAEDINCRCTLLPIVED